jgi:hypothetical protein
LSHTCFQYKAIAFRRGFGWPTASANLASVIVKIGARKSTPNNGYFLSNFNGSITTVYDGPWSFSGDRCKDDGGNSIPCPFDAIINFTKPYLYQADSGLLVDVYASEAANELSWEFATACAGCYWVYSTLGNTPLASGDSANVSPQMKLFTTDVAPASPPQAPPSTPASVFFLPNTTSESVSTGVLTSSGLPLAVANAGGARYQTVRQRPPIREY